MFPHMVNLLEIPNTLNVLIDCWEVAEKNLRHDIDAYHPDSGEEFITQLFYGKYAAILSYASQCKHIENAFFEDLKAAFTLPTNHLAGVSTGLIGEITLHKRATERITGGDIGLLIIRPQVYNDGYNLNVSDYRRGLLCQAKLKNRKGKWGNFTERQRIVLPDQLKYLGLLLYSYEDEERHKLDKFRWQVCDSIDFLEVENSLRQDSFPNLVSSDHIIENIGYGTLGTDDDDIIDSLISPSKNPTLIIRITWPDGQGPPGGPGGLRSITQTYSEQEDILSQYAIKANFENPFHATSKRLLKS